MTGLSTTERMRLQDSGLVQYPVPTARKPTKRDERASKGLCLTCGQPAKFNRTLGRPGNLCPACAEVAATKQREKMRAIKQEGYAR